MFLEFRIASNEQNFTDTALHYLIQKVWLLHAVNTEKENNVLTMKCHLMFLGSYCGSWNASSEIRQVLNLCLEPSELKNRLSFLKQTMT